MTYEQLVAKYNHLKRSVAVGQLSSADAASQTAALNTTAIELGVKFDHTIFAWIEYGRCCGDVPPDGGVMSLTADDEFTPSYGDEDFSDEWSDD